MLGAQKKEGDKTTQPAGPSLGRGDGAELVKDRVDGLLHRLTSTALVFVYVF